MDFWVTAYGYLRWQHFLVRIPSTYVFTVFHTSLIWRNNQVDWGKIYILDLKKKKKQQTQKPRASLSDTDINVFLRRKEAWRTMEEKRTKSDI